MKYECYSIGALKKAYEVGRNWNSEQDGNITRSEKFEDIELFNAAFSGYRGIELDFTEHIFYRIGEPRLNPYGTYYLNSYNFAEQCSESGVSVISEKWLNSLKSVFFGTSDEDLKAKGVYKIKGVIIDYGGDDEPLIYPTDWAEKTSICCKDDILKAIKAEQEASENG